MNYLNFNRNNLTLFVAIVKQSLYAIKSNP